ncbi:DUF5683 domain-containing protein [Lunatibacter salilacus]|uniref:DUF5683 domain-containing protein n=1 Tax=Lunatibacter salilacus TaxID=2483804 RepID=UPI00131BF3A6|nr:DUF5683 domain-containing protein [Lunatibacter salilacus]
MDDENGSTVIGDFKSIIENKGKWIPGTAAFLSFIIPGWGQIYKGQLKTGIIWLIVTAACYFFAIILGLFIHIICTLEAAYVKPDK